MTQLQLRQKQKRNADFADAQAEFVQNAASHAAKTPKQKQLQQRQEGFRAAEQEYETQKQQYAEETWKNALTLAEQQDTDRSRSIRWTALPAGEQTVPKTTVDPTLQTRVRQQFRNLNWDYSDTMDAAKQQVSQRITQQQTAMAQDVGNVSPALGALYGMGSWVTDLTGAVYTGANAVANLLRAPEDRREVDINGPEFRGTQVRNALKEGAAQGVTERYGDTIGQGFRIGMDLAETAHMLATGASAAGLDISSSAVNRYISLIKSGVPPKEAGIRTGLSAGLEALDAFGVADDVLGAAVKKTGLGDAVVDLARKLPGAEKVIRAVDERIFDGLFRTGMDLEDLDEPLTRQAEKELLDRVVQENGITDRELGQAAKLVQAETRDIAYPDVDVSGNLLDLDGKKSRPTWRQSEEDAKKMYPEHRPQVSFGPDGKEVKYGTKGSVRPDLFKDGSCIEVKNYRLGTEKQADRLVNNVVMQYNQRVNILPKGTQQIVWIDTRGQNVSRDRMEWIQDEILSQTQMNMIVVFKVE